MEINEDSRYLKCVESCSVFYSAFSIPVYIIRKGKLEGKFPCNQEEYNIPFLFIEEMERSEAEIAFYMTQISTYFCYFGVPELDMRIYLGPVGTIPYSDELMKQIWRYYQVPADLRNPSFYRSIPPHPINEFLAILNVLYYMCTGKSFDPALIPSVHPKSHETEENNITDFIHIYMEHQLDLLDEDYYNNSYDVEQLFLQCIENGDTAAAERLLRESIYISAGHTAADMGSQNQNLYIAAITLYTRAAIRGGLDTQTAFTLSDAYLQQLNKRPSPDVLQRLLTEAFLEFTRRVNQLVYPPDVKADLLQCIQFINRNVTRRITVAEVADYIGYSRQHLSTRFKKELGFDLSRFILRAKLSEAQKLLRFSRKSLSEISALLCFSSQSHFQRNFKAQFGLTPLEYRKQARAPEPGNAE